MLRGRATRLSAGLLSRASTSRAVQPLKGRRFVSVQSEGPLADTKTPLTTELKFLDNVVDGGLIPAYRILSKDGSVLDGAEVPEV